MAYVVLRRSCGVFQEEELRRSGEAKFQHLTEDLHVLIEVFAPPAEAYARMGHALEEIKKFLIPVRVRAAYLVPIINVPIHNSIVVLGAHECTASIN